MEKNKILYHRMVDDIRLAASSFKIQKEVLPEFVHLPDEVLNALDIVLVPQLVRSGLITKEQENALREYDEFLHTVKVSEDYETALEEMENSNQFKELRKRAHNLLKILGENYERPNLDGVIYVKGA